ncbi:MAG TPA: FGGY-family carbohydrate kinase [Candidatus Atribacteria bacterium]|nr:FGGY-family carbohydrate kinase [Candidatus Atribacteria bacterium]
MGIDVGTSGCKVVAFTEGGEIIASGYEEYPFLTPRSGWLELDPDKIWEAVLNSLKKVAAQTGDTIDAIAVNSHGETLIPLGRDGQVLYRAIANFDTRSERYVDFWKERLDPFQIFQITGMPLHGMYTVNKILWLRDEKPDIFEKVDKFCCVEDFVLHRLTGEEPVIDYSLAARTMMLDVVHKKWSDEILHLASLDKDKLPRLSPSGEEVGHLRPSLAQELGLSSIVMVATGGHDQPCGVLGCGVRKEGEAMYGMGTSDCVALNLGEKPRLTQEMMENGFCCYPHVVKDSYLTLSYIASGGSVLRWFRDTFGGEEKEIAKKEGKDPYQVLIDTIPSHPSSLFLLPHLAGSGTPYLDGYSRGTLLGLTFEASKGEIVRTILESLTYEMKINLDLWEEFGIPLYNLRAVGGGARSTRWLQIRADILQKPLFPLFTEEAVALGSAMLGGKARGIFSNLDEAIAAMVRFGKEVSPSPDKKEAYQLRYKIYQKIYGAVREINEEISKLL